MRYFHALLLAGVLAAGCAHQKPPVTPMPSSVPLPASQGLPFVDNTIKALKDTVIHIAATQTYIDCGKQASGGSRLLVILPDGKKVALDHCAAAQDSKYATEMTKGNR